MDKFLVTVGGVKYKVDAPDERTAWDWANATHMQAIKNDGAAPAAAPAPKRDDMSRVADKRDQVPYDTGAKVNDYVAKYLPAPFAAGLGAATNAGLEGAQMVASGGFGALTGAAAKPALQEGGRMLMRSALKPSTKAALNGNGERAVNTLLEEGLNVSHGGSGKLQGIGTDMNKQVSAIIEPSSAKVPMQFVDDAVSNARGRFANSPDQVGDYAAIDSAASKFLSNNKLTGLGAREVELAREVEQKRLARIAALQDSGRYQTMAAQQENLAHGGGVNLPTRGTPINEPYMNVGSGGGRSLSPSAYPAQEGMIGNVRTPGQYTHNIDRVPEAQSAAAEFERIAKLRALEQELAEVKLSTYQKSGGSGLPIQTAQELKQGLHQNLRDKYGTLGAADVETQKSLAHELRLGIEKEVPAVAPLNKRASDMWNAANLVDRRMAVADNRNPLGLAAISPTTWPAALMDRSELLKSLLARGLYQSGNAAPYLGGAAGMASALRDNE